YVGVAFDHRNLLQLQPQALGDDLGERGLVALTLGKGSGFDDRRAVLGDLHGPELGLGDSVGDLYVHAQADAQVERAALGATLGLRLAQLLVSGGLQRAVQRADVVAAVVERPGCGRVRERVGGDEVAPAPLRR